MSTIKRVGSLELSQDDRFQNIEWKLQRVGWALMALVLLATALGLLGDGPLAHASAGDAASGLAVEYQRVERRHSTSEITLEVVNPSPGEPLRLHLPSDYLADIGMREIIPPPTSTYLVGNEAVFEYAPADDALGEGGSPSQITLRIQPEAYGQVRGAVAMEGGPRVDLAQFVLP